MINVKSIEGIYISDLEDILLGNAGVKVSKVSSPSIFLSNKAVIKCAVKYYRNKRTGHKPDKKQMKCFYAKKILFEEDKKTEATELNDCVSCHLRCMNDINLILPLQDCRKEME